MRVAFLAALLVGSAALGQSDPCTLKCSQTMGTCASRCSSDQRCSERCMQHMDNCQQQCIARGKVQPLPKNLPKMCPGTAGTMVPCADMMAGTKRPKLEKGTYPNKQAKDMMKAHTKTP